MRTAVVVMDPIPVAKVSASMAQVIFDRQRRNIGVVAWRPRAGR